MKPLVWKELDRSALRHNFRVLRRLAGSRVAVIPVVKANAYGHGASEVARVLAEAGARLFAVASLAEAVELRQAGVTGGLLVLTPGLPEEAGEVLGWRAAQMISGPAMARALSRAAVRRGVRAQVHLKVDTGMGRLGVAMDEAPKLWAELSRLPGLQWEGWGSHLATADLAGGRAQVARRQIRAFVRVMEQMAAIGSRPPLRHIANSAATALLPESRRPPLTAVRPGLLVYGILPTPRIRRLAVRPALTVKTRILHVKEVPAGTGLSYGLTVVTARRTRVATLGAGYSHGFPREVSNRGAVLIRGRRAPVLGRVCMDQTLVDVTEHPPVGAGEEAVLMGRQGQEAVTAEALAAQAGTIPYAIVCGWGARLPTRFV